MCRCVRADVSACMVWEVSVRCVFCMLARARLVRLFELLDFLFLTMHPLGTQRNTSLLVLVRHMDGRAEQSCGLGCFTQRAMQLLHITASFLPDHPSRCMRMRTFSTSVCAHMDVCLQNAATTAPRPCCVRPDFAGAV